MASARVSRPCFTRNLNASSVKRDRSFTNILADDSPPAVQVKSITDIGIQLLDGLLIPSACIFLEGKVFLWDVPPTLWTEWGTEHFEIFETIIPKPEILILGTGKSIAHVPAALRTYLNKLGIQVDVMDTVRSIFNYLFALPTFDSEERMCNLQPIVRRGSTCRCCPPANVSTTVA
ncbi:hypothetical protein H0H87_011081 [Tephrocybe sp. NHM501043]|nr:hypothetical protein H0H87_011081 [Tephrocybe sp. NHM501043]